MFTYQHRVKTVGNCGFFMLIGWFLVGVWRSPVARTLGVGEVARSNRVTPIKSRNAESQGIQGFAAFFYG
jgi:hypothetical protein